MLQVFHSSLLMDVFHSFFRLLDAKCFYVHYWISAVTSCFSFVWSFEIQYEIYYFWGIFIHCHCLTKINSILNYN